AAKKRSRSRSHGCGSRGSARSSMCSMFFEFPVGSLKAATPGTRRNGLVRGRIRYRQPPDPQPHAERRPDAARPSRAVVELYGARNPSPPRVADAPAGGHALSSKNSAVCLALSGRRKVRRGRYAERRRKAKRRRRHASAACPRWRCPISTPTSSTAAISTRATPRNWPPPSWRCETRSCARASRRAMRGSLGRSLHGASTATLPGDALRGRRTEELRRSDRHGLSALGYRAAGRRRPRHWMELIEHRNGLIHRWTRGRDVVALQVILDGDGGVV